MHLMEYITKFTGGERGIRTLDRVAPVPPFQGGDLNRSSISPIQLLQARIIRDTTNEIQPSLD
jgi:hypothetical protein